MNFFRNNGSHSKHFLFMSAICASLLLTGCGSSDTSGSQARNDLTAEHVRGLYSGMKRSDIEDLLGGSDKSLAEKESIEVYSLSDGTTAILRYREDTLMSAYLRDKDNMETSLFGQDSSNLPGINGVNDTESSLDSNSIGESTGGSTSGTSTPDDSNSNSSNGTSSLEDSILNDAADSATEGSSESNESESR